MIIPTGTDAQLDFLIRAEAETLAREEYELASKVHDPDGISTCADPWDDLDAGAEDDDEPESYTRVLLIDVKERLLRDLSRRESMDAASWRLARLVQLPGLDAYRTAPHWRRFNGRHWTIGNGRCVEFREAVMDSIEDAAAAMITALGVAVACPVERSPGVVMREPS